MSCWSTDSDLSLRPTLRHARCSVTSCPVSKVCTHRIRSVWLSIPAPSGSLSPPLSAVECFGFKAATMI